MVDLLELQRSNLLSHVFRGEYRRRPGGRTDWRVLVIDKVTKVTIDNLFTWDQILSENIVGIENIEDEERTPTNFPAIYLLSSECGQAAVLRGLRKEFRGDRAAKLFTQELNSPTKFSHHPLVHDAITTTLENMETDSGCCLVYLAEALNPREPTKEDLEEALKEELAKYRKNRGGHVFLVGSRRVDFTTAEFLETAAAGMLVHQVIRNLVTRPGELPPPHLDGRELQHIHPGQPAGGPWLPTCAGQGAGQPGGGRHAGLPHHGPVPGAHLPLQPLQHSLPEVLYQADSVWAYNLATTVQRERTRHTSGG